MRGFTAAAGTVFGLIVVAHLWRVAVEGLGVATPFFVAITLATAAMSGWAWRVWWTARPR